MFSSQRHKGYLFLFFLIFYIIIIYFNTLNVPFVLDDRINIVERKNLHLSQISLKSVMDTFFMQQNGSQKLFRPISCFTIAFNYFIGKFNVTGYHIVNLIIHLFSSVFLFKTLQLILVLKSGHLKENQINLIAGFATLLWATNPIQIQAVTYIIQRMASLSAMFYIMGIWAYINFRISYEKQENPQRMRYLIMAICFLVGAILSKENTVVFPLTIISIEAFFFNGIDRLKNNPIKSFLIIISLGLLPILLFVHTTSFDKIIAAYDHRPYTLSQRLLTEPRVIFFYISQIFYPVPGRFSLTHSFELSESFVSPISTLFSISGIALLLFVSCFKAKKYPYIGFSIVFYFCHHLVESTIIALELVFEHRNYLPSLFLFLPISNGLFLLLSKYETYNRSLYYCIVAFCISIIFLFGLSTYIRNKDWISHESIWKNAVNKSPDLIRPYAQLGWYHTNTKRPNTKKARYYFIKGLEKQPSYSVFEKAFLWLNIAKSYEQENKFFEAKKAMLNCLKSLNYEVHKKPKLLDKNLTKNYLSNINYYLANLNYTLNNLQLGMDHINQALEISKHPNFLNTKAKLLIHQNEYEQALSVLQISLKENHDNWNTYFLTGYTMTSLGYHSQGLWFYYQAKKLIKKYRINSSVIDFYIADNIYLSGDSNAAFDLIKKRGSNNLQLLLNNLRQIEHNKNNDFHKIKSIQHFIYQTETEIRLWGCGEEE